MLRAAITRPGAESFLSPDPVDRGHSEAGVAMRLGRAVMAARSNGTALRAAPNPTTSTGNPSPAGGFGNRGGAARSAGHHLVEDKNETDPSPARLVAGAPPRCCGQPADRAFPLLLSRASHPRQAAGCPEHTDKETA